MGASSAGDVPVVGKGEVVDGTESHDLLEEVESLISLGGGREISDAGTTTTRR